jgi:peptidoglycan/LPS O-acetylase OafA/YrhL
VASVLSVFAAAVYLVNMRAIRKKETHADDKGKLAVESTSSFEGETRHLKDKSLKNRSKKAGETVKQNVGLIVFVVIALFQVGFFSIIPKIIAVTDSALNSSPILGLLCMAVSGILMVVSITEDKKIPCKSRPVGAVVAFVGTLAGFLTAVVNPVEDIYYYACVIFMFICMLIALIDLTEKANTLATRPLPSFERKGGDQRG